MQFCKLNLMIQGKLFIGRKYTLFISRSINHIDIFKNLLEKASFHLFWKLKYGLPIVH